jgi:molybdenum cofactor cytidylyltransferase
MSIATIILAAGSSSRLEGTPKQLIQQDGQTLVRRIAREALALQAGPVIAVLGANEALIQAELADLPVLIVSNSDWREGLASSLRTGLDAVSDEKNDAFLVVLTDQPHITADLLEQLIITRQQTSKGIVACRYGEPGNLGVPALFDIQYKSEFLQLSGDVGARKLVQQHIDDCVEVSFPLAAIDLDTKQDVEVWAKSREVGA